MMTPEQQAIIDAKASLGQQLGREPTLREVAEAMGLSYQSVKSRWKRARKWQVPEGIKAATEAAGLDLSSATHGWRVIPREDGGRDSVFWRNETSPEDHAAAILEALEGVPAKPAIEPATLVDEDLLTLYPIPDLHLGMMAWRRETGEPYDTDIAADRVVSWVMRAVEASPPSKDAVILGLGDMLHADDQSNQTPRSKHQLDVDTRHHRTLHVAIVALAAAIEYAAQKHARVRVRLLPGNHDPHSFLAVMFALRERYRLSAHVTVDDAPGEFFVRQFGKVMLAAHHGDKGNAQRLAHFIADEYAPIWGRTKYRYLFTGHLHSLKSQDIGGIQWEQLRAVGSRDAYAVSNAYAARAQLTAITYHRERGEVFRACVAK